MTIRMTAALAGAAGVLCLTIGLGAAAQEFNDKPLEENWWPTEWGPDDKVGAPNRTTPEMVMKAVGLVKQGKTATLGKLYAADIPFFGARGFLLKIPGTPTGGPFGSNGLVFHDELVTDRDRPGRHPVRRPGPYRRADLEGRPVLQRPRARGRPTSAARAIWSSAWATSASSTSPRKASSAAGCCSTPPSTGA